MLYLFSALYPARDGSFKWDLDSSNQLHLLSALELRCDDRVDSLTSFVQELHLSSALQLRCDSLYAAHCACEAWLHLLSALRPHCDERPLAARRARYGCTYSAHLDPIATNCATA